jgi:hypothetical protein
VSDDEAGIDAPDGGDPPRKRRDKASDVVDMVLAGRMPLSRFTLIHRTPSSLMAT